MLKDAALVRPADGVNVAKYVLSTFLHQHFYIYNQNQRDIITKSFFMDEKYVPDITELHLEPRVARLETGLETLTRNVSEMAVSMRENSNDTNRKIDALIVSVTQAQAPKKTDWSLFVSIAFLIMALASAVFWPLSQQTQNNKEDLKALHTSYVDHTRLDMHPVGQARVNALVKSADETRMELTKRDADLDTKIQKETALMLDLVNAKLAALDNRLQSEMNLKNEIFNVQIRAQYEKQDLVNDRMYARVLKLEAVNSEEYSKNMDELRAWRSKANGLSSPCATIPLVGRDMVEPTKK
jgi:hypothetical protein